MVATRSWLLGDDFCHINTNQETQVLKHLFKTNALSQHMLNLTQKGLCRPHKLRLLQAPQMASARLTQQSFPQSGCFYACVKNMRQLQINYEFVYVSTRHCMTKPCIILQSHPSHRMTRDQKQSLLLPPFQNLPGKPEMLSEQFSSLSQLPRGLCNRVV